MNDDRRALLKAAEAIVASAKDPDLAWTVNSATHLAEMIRDEAPDHEVRIQCKYVLSHSRYWRADDAQRIRKVLRHFCEHKRSEL